MKVLYIGSGDLLAQEVVRALTKEGHKVSCIINGNTSIKKGGIKIYEYNVRKFDSQISEIMKFVSPDIIIYAGNITKDYIQDENARDLTQLQKVLKQSVRYNVKKILYFSSLEVYGNSNSHIDQAITEESFISPKTDLGLYHAEQEYMLKLYGESNQINITILRCGPIFWGENTSFMYGTEKAFASENTYQPIHIKDIAIAVSRLVEDEEDINILNICGSKAYNMDLLNEDHRDYTLCKTKFSNKKIKDIIDWTDFYEFQPDQNIWQTDTEEKKTVKKEKSIKSIIRQLIENIVLLVVFLVPNIMLADHGLFQNVDWMLIYIVVVSLYLGMTNSMIAVILASGSYLFVNKINIFQFSNIYSYLGYLIIVAEYIFFGIVVAYSNNMIKNKLNDLKMDYDLLNTDYQELKGIFNQNTVIMKEYESRVLNLDDTLPKLQSIIGKLNVLEPNKIFMEINYVVSDLLKTDTVAVYRKDENSSYLRLVASLNEKSTYGGKSWNLSVYPEIEEKVLQNEIAVGKAWSEEPGMTIPIFVEGICAAVIVVKQLSMETRSLYYLNIMRTLLKMISDAVNRAVNYQKLIEDKRYIDQTTVLTAEEFEKQISLAKEYSEGKIASYTLLRIPHMDWRKIYKEVDKKIRSIDYIGLNKDGDLSILLVNTAKNECAPVIERLSNIGVTALIYE